MDTYTANARAHANLVEVNMFRVALLRAQLSLKRTEMLADVYKL